MNEDQLQREIEELENWFSRFPDPKPSRLCKERVRVSIALESGQQHLDGVAAPALADQIKQNIKSAVREELKRASSLTLDHQPPWGIQIYPWLAAAAVLVLAVGTSLFITNVNRNNFEDSSFELMLAMNPEISDIAAEISEIELRTLAMDYWLVNSQEDPVEFQEQMERLFTPSYQMNFMDESHFEGDQ